MGPLRLVSGVHDVRDIDFTRVIQRELDPDLMTYRHLKRKVWVVGMWLDKPSRVVQEVMVLPPLPSINRKTMKELRVRVKGGPMISEMIQRCKAMPRAHLRDLDEMQAAWDDQKDAIKKSLVSKVLREHPLLQKGD